MTDGIREQTTKAGLEARLTKAESFLRSALSEWNINCLYGDCTSCPDWIDGKCSQDWSERENVEAFLSILDNPNISYEEE